MDVVGSTWWASGRESGFGPATAPPFWLRATEALPNLVGFTVTALPVTAVLLAALAGCSAGTVRWVTLTAVIIQTVALALGLIAWVAVLGKTSRWTPLSLAVEIAAATAGLVVTSAVLRSRGAVTVTRPRRGADKR